MKRLSKLKLHEVSVISNAEMKQIVGGYSYTPEWYAGSSPAICVGTCFNEEYQEDGRWRGEGPGNCKCVPLG